MVKNVFLVIMGVTVALVLYVILFGTTNLTGVQIDEKAYTKTTGYKKLIAWEGALWYMARNMESPIARYYYDYCYVPNVMQSYDTDLALGMTVKYPDLNSIPTDLSGIDLVNIKTINNPYPCYTSGWK